MGTDVLFLNHCNIINN